MSNIIKASQITGEYKLEDDFIREKQKENDIARKKVNRDISPEDIAHNNQIIMDAQERAEEIIQAAQEKAEKILADADKQVEVAFKEASDNGYQEGFQKGYQDGEKESLDKFKTLMTSFDNIIKETKKQLDRDVENNQKNFIKLAFKISNKIIKTEIKTNPELINSIVLDMLKQMTDIDSVRVHVHPDLIEYIDKDDLESEYVRQNIDFLGDNKLKKGDCVVETDFGGKDGTIKNKLNLLEKELLKGAGFDD